MEISALFDDPVIFSFATYILPHMFHSHPEDDPASSVQTINKISPTLLSRRDDTCCEMMAGYCLVNDYDSQPVIISQSIIFVFFSVTWYIWIDELRYFIWWNMISPGFGECGKVFHHSSTEFSFAGRVVTRHVERMTENVFNFIGVHDSHPLPPRVRARSLLKFLSIIISFFKI